MPASARWAAIVVPAVLLAAATPGRADERCTGTLCDLYYGGPPQPGAPKPAAPQPLTVPQTLSVPGAGMLGRLFGGNAPAAPAGTPAAGAAPASRPLLGVQGGGLIGRANGQPAERCSGTLCDLFYGGPSPEEQHAFDDRPARPPGQTASPQAASPQAAAAEQPTPEQVADPGDTPPPATRRRQPAEAQRCAATGRDPWSCYR